MAFNLGNLRKLASLSKLGRGDPQFSYSWEISIRNKNTNMFFNFLNNISFFAKTVTLPQTAVERIEIAFLGEKISYAGKDASSKTVTVSFWDDEQLTVYRYFRSWMNNISEANTGRQVRKSEYVGEMDIRLRHQTDLVNNGVIKLGRVFPMEISEVPLSYDSSEPMEVTVTLSFDFNTFEQ